MWPILNAGFLVLLLLMLPMFVVLTLFSLDRHAIRGSGTEGADPPAHRLAPGRSRCLCLVFRRIVRRLAKLR